MARSAEIVHLPGTRLTPEVVLHQCVDEIDSLKAVVVLKLDKEGDSYATWSQMDLGDLCYLLTKLQSRVHEIMSGRGQEFVG